MTLPLNRFQLLQEQTPTLFWIKSNICFWIHKAGITFLFCFVCLFWFLCWWTCPLVGVWKVKIFAADLYSGVKPSELRKGFNNSNSVLLSPRPAPLFLTFYFCFHKWAFSCSPKKDGITVRCSSYICHCCLSSTQNTTLVAQLNCPPVCCRDSRPLWLPNLFNHNI